MVSKGRNSRFQTSFARPAKSKVGWTIYIFLVIPIVLVIFWIILASNAFKHAKNESKSNKNFNFLPINNDSHVDFEEQNELEQHDTASSREGMCNIYNTSQNQH